MWSRFLCNVHPLDKVKGKLFLKRPAVGSFFETETVIWSALGLEVEES